MLSSQPAAEAPQTQEVRLRDLLGELDLQGLQGLLEKVQGLDLAGLLEKVRTIQELFVAGKELLPIVLQLMECFKDLAPEQRARLVSMATAGVYQDQTQQAEFEQRVMRLVA